MVLDFASHLVSWLSHLHNDNKKQTYFTGLLVWVKRLAGITCLWMLQRSPDLCSRDMFVLKPQQAEAD